MVKKSDVPFLEHTILDYFSLGPKKTDGEVGIEIEVEANNPLPTNEEVLPHWVRTQDGSLRGPYTAEYVLSTPVRREDVRTVLDHLHAARVARKVVFNDSARAGVHVHINCQEMTMRQVITMATLYFVAEDALINYSGQGRRGNHFCLRARDAEYLIYGLTDFYRNGMCREVDPFTDAFRYASLNVTALRKYGSLEFRSLRSTQNMNNIEHWVRLLLCLKDAAIGMFRNPRQIIEQISFDGERQMMRNIFGSLEKDLVYEPINILEGARICQDIAYCRKDW